MSVRHPKPQGHWGGQDVTEKIFGPVSSIRAIISYMRRTTKRSQKSNAIQPKFKYMWIIYWSKVLTDQQGSCRYFRKHKIVKNLKTATIKQVIIHLSNLLKRFFRKSHYVFFWSKMESTLPQYAPSISQLLIIPCIGHSRSHFLPLVLNGKKRWFAYLWVLFVLRFISDNVFIKG